MDDQNHAHLAFGQAELSAQESFQLAARQSWPSYDCCENNSVGAWGRSTHTVGEAPIDDLAADLFTEKQDLL